jgi:hypothetical protein
MTIRNQRELLWIVSLSIVLGAALSFLQPGNWLPGWLEFSAVFFICLSLLVISTRWADGGKSLVWIVAIAFALRFAGGVATYLALPVDGFEDEDDRAGFVYTDARRRDVQAWELARSDHPILDAFNKRFAYDQYGGLLAVSSFTYRYISPDAHRPLMLVLLAAFAGAAGLPFLWKGASRQWGTATAAAACWIFALYPESLLLGGSSMREPYLMTFSAFTLWGFVSWQSSHGVHPVIWFGLGILGMLLVSPAAAVVTLLLFAGWMYFASGRGRLSWLGAVLMAVLFLAGLFMLASALDRGGNLGGGTPLAVINNFLREAVKMDIHHLERSSGWVQKLFDEMPEGLRIPFVLVYGIFQPVLPAALVEPTTLTWRIIAILRALGWYAMLPMLILSFVAAAGQETDANRRLSIWISLVTWGWILLTSLRGGADQWDNPRYRTILCLWQAILAAVVWIWWREKRNPWFWRVIAMELIFLAFFGQWYANRYFHLGSQLPFAHMVGYIFGCWVLVLLWGVWRDRVRRAGPGV